MPWRALELKFKGKSSTRKTRTRWCDWVAEDIKLKRIRKRNIFGR
jgi:hypothetical protein